MDEPKAPTKEQPDAAYFLSLTLENVRCFGPKQTISFAGKDGRHAQWTVILGNNGVGKTTLLQCLVGALPIQIFEKSISTFPNAEILHATIFNWMHQGYDIFRYNCKITSCEIFSKVQIQKADGNNEAIVFGLWESNPGVNTENLAAFRQKPLITAYGANRRMSTGNYFEETRFSIDGLFSDKIELVNAEDWLLQADYAASKDASFSDRRDSVKSVLLNILPEIDDIRFEDPTKANPTPGVRFLTKYGWVKLSQLSLGYKTLIAWMVDFASRLFDRYPHSANPLAEPAICLVDEIDLHLHPTWQRKLLGYLSERFPKTQFIVTAHSPLIVQAAPDANIVLLKREDDHVVIDNDVASIRNWRVDQILTSELFGLDSAWPPYLDTPMEERRKILSKGSLDDADRNRLKEIENRVGSMPVGETPEDIEALDIIRQAAKLLKAEKVS